MIALPAPRRFTAAGIAVVVVATLGLCWHPSWWTAGLLLVAQALLVVGWRRAARERDRTLERFARLRAQIEDLHITQGRFVGNIAHEIKTPLAVVMGETEVLLLRCNDPAAVREITASMATEVRHLSDLVNSFLLLAHPPAHDADDTHVPVFVGDVVIAAVARCRSLSVKLGVRLVAVFDTLEDDPPTAEVLGDHVLLEAMVENLLRNALRFSHLGGQVELAVHTDVDEVRIVVRDHGIGIPPDDRESVFAWFFERPEQPSRTTGTGFGLAIAKRVADHHGGTITLRDTAGGGCEFEVCLPRFWPSSDPATDAPERIERPPAPAT